MVIVTWTSIKHKVLMMSSPCVISHVIELTGSFHLRIALHQQQMMADQQLTEIDQMFIDYALHMETGEINPILEAAVHYALSDPTSPPPYSPSEQEGSFPPPGGLWLSPTEVDEMLNSVLQPLTPYEPLQGHLQPVHQYTEPVHQYTAPAAASQEQCENFPVTYQHNIWWNQYVPVGNGEQSYQLVGGDFTPAAPPAAAPAPKSIQNRRKQGGYVKKPPNSFMLFMREQRPLVDPAIRKKGSGEVNAELGRIWKSLSAAEKEQFYQQAQIESQLHYQQHPDWSAKENYGIKRRRDRRRKFPSIAEES